MKKLITGLVALTLSFSSCTSFNNKTSNSKPSTKQDPDISSDSVIMFSYNVLVEVPDKKDVFIDSIPLTTKKIKLRSTDSTITVADSTTKTTFKLAEYNEFNKYDKTHYYLPIDTSSKYSAAYYYANNKVLHISLKGYKTAGYILIPKSK